MSFLKSIKSSLIISFSVLHKVPLFYRAATIDESHEEKERKSKVRKFIQIYCIVPSLFYRAASMDASRQGKEEKYEVRKFYFSVKTNISSKYKY